MSKYEGLFTFDVDNHRFIPVGQADGIISNKYNPEPKEEPKEYWWIDGCGDVSEEYFDGGCVDGQRTQIGNYFETEEEAKKAVEKLKAWQRLKEAGFKFTDWHRDICEVAIEAEIHDDGTMGMINDLNLIFGGE